MIFFHRSFTVLCKALSTNSIMYSAKIFCVLFKWVYIGLWYKSNRCMCVFTKPLCPLWQTAVFMSLERICSFARACKNATPQVGWRVSCKTMTWAVALRGRPKANGGGKQQWIDDPPGLGGEGSRGARKAKGRRSVVRGSLKVKACRSKTLRATVFVFKYRSSEYLGSLFMSERD